MTHSSLADLSKSLQKMTLTVHGTGKQHSGLDRLAESTLAKVGIAAGADRGSGGISADTFERLREEVVTVAPSASQLLVRCWP